MSLDAAVPVPPPGEFGPPPPPEPPSGPPTAPAATTPPVPPAPPSVAPPAGPAGPVAGARERLLGQRRAAAAAPSPGDAAVLLETLARDATAELGRYDRDTLVTWRELAWYRDAAGDHVGAVHLLQQLVLDMAQALGAADPDTLHARFDLACATGNAGGSQAAVQQLYGLIPQLAATLGPYDARVLKAQHDLALHIANTGDRAGALHQLRQLVPLVQQTLGEAHPLLSEVRLDLGRYAELWGLTKEGRGAGLTWVEAVAFVHRLLVWDFDTDQEADACLRELERRTGVPGLLDRVMLAPDHLTAEQVALAALGAPPPGY